ncbi:unnamed protein product, partial [Protopolystoma xenopodis]
AAGISEAPQVSFHSVAAFSTPLPPPLPIPTSLRPTSPPFSSKFPAYMMLLGQSRPVSDHTLIITSAQSSARHSTRLSASTSTGAHRQADANYARESLECSAQTSQAHTDDPTPHTPRTPRTPLHFCRAPFTGVGRHALRLAAAGLDRTTSHEVASRRQLKTPAAPVSVAPLDSLGHSRLVFARLESSSSASEPRSLGAADPRAKSLMLQLSRSAGVICSPHCRVCDGYSIREAGAQVRRVSEAERHGRTDGRTEWSVCVGQAVRLATHTRRGSHARTHTCLHWCRSCPSPGEKCTLA